MACRGGLWAALVVLLFAALPSVTHASCRSYCFPDYSTQYFTLKQGGKCLGYVGWFGSTVEMQSCTSPSPLTQQWRYTTTGTLVSAYGGCLSVRGTYTPTIAGEGNNNGVVMEMNRCTATDVSSTGKNQVFIAWQPGNVNRNSAQITTVVLGTALTLNVDSTNNGAGFGSCVDVDTSTQTKVQLWTCGYTGGGSFQASQNFMPTAPDAPVPSTVFTVTGLPSAGTGRCLDVPNGSKEQGAYVQSWDCSSTNANQAWAFRNDGTLYNAAAQMCLNSQGTDVVTDYCVGTWWNSLSTQGMVWSVALLSSGSSSSAQFRNVKNNECLDAAAGTNGWIMQLSTCSSSAASQQFQLTSSAVSALKATPAGSVPLWTAPAAAPPPPASVTPSPPPPAGAGPVTSAPPQSSPPPYSPPAYVSDSMTLGGLSVATFGTVEAQQFTNAVATAFEVSYYDVTITSVTAPAGRHLLQSSVTVAYTVKTTAAAASSIMAALRSDATAASAWIMSQMPAVTSVSLPSTPPTTGSTAPPVVNLNLPYTGTPTRSSPSAAHNIKPAACLAVAAALAARQLL